MATGRAVDFSQLILASCSVLAGREWLLDHVKIFLNQSSSTQTMVVIGDPGAGKTTVLARIIKDTNAAHFFLGRSDWITADHGGGWSEPIRCAETLGTQLVKFYGSDIVDWSRFGLDVRIRAKNVYGRLTGAELKVFEAGPRPVDKHQVHVDIDINTLGNPGVVTGLSIQELRIDPMLAFQELFLGPLRRAAQKTKENIVIVLDGLDEWDRVASHMDILEILQRSKLPENIRIIASARPRYALRLSAGTLVIDISDTNKQSVINSDVAKLIDNTMNINGIALDSKVRNDIIAQSQGNFLFAHYLLQTLDPDEQFKPLSKLPIGLESYYHQELIKLVDQLTLEGVRGSLGTLLAVICSAREPLDIKLAAGAADLQSDIATDVLQRMLAFIRQRQSPSGVRYSPFHLSLSDYVLSGRAGLGITSQSGHRRLAESLVPNDGGMTGWLNVTDYAIRHAMAHAILAGEDSNLLARSLIDNPEYLVARVARIGPEALDEDLRHANQIGYDPPYFGALVIELALRAQFHSSAGVSAAQGLAITAAAVGAQQLALDFSKLAPDSVVAHPKWNSGLQSARLAAGGIRCEGNIEAATLSAGFLLTIVRNDKTVEIWNLEEHLCTASLPRIEGLEMAQLEPDGCCLWTVVTLDKNSSKLQRKSLPDGIELQAHHFQQPITALRISADGKHIAVGTEAGRVYLVDITTSTIVSRREIGEKVACLRFDGVYLAALTSRRKVVCWNLLKLNLEGLRVLPFKCSHFAHIDRTEGLALDAAQCSAIVGGVDGSLTEVYISDDEISPKHLATLNGWADHVALLNKTQVIAGDSEGFLHFIARDSRHPNISFRAHSSAIVLVEAYVHPGLVLTVACAGEIGYWKTPVENIDSSMTHDAAIMDLKFSASNDRLMSFGYDGSLFEWTSEGRIRQAVYLKKNEFNFARIAHNFTSLIIEKGSIRKLILEDEDDSILSVTSWPKIIIDKCSGIFSSHPTPLSITDDSNLVATANRESVEIWQVTPMKLIMRISNAEAVGLGALSGDGSLLITKDTDKNLWLRNLDSGELPQSIPIGGSVLCAPFVSDAGIKLLTCVEQEIYCLSTDPVALDVNWTMTSDHPSFAVPTPDGKILIIFGAKGQVEIRRRVDGRHIGGFALRPPASTATFSNDGRMLAIGDVGGGVQVYRLLLTGVS